MIRVDQGRLNLNFIVVIFGFFYVELRKFLKRVKTSKGSKGRRLRRLSAMFVRIIG